MDLKKVNEEYVKLVGELEKAKKEYEVASKVDLKKLIRHKQQLKWQIEDIGDDITSTEAQKKQKERALNDQIKEIDEQIQKIKDKATEKRKNVEEIQSKINERIAKVQNDPEMKKHIEEALSKKITRKMKRIQQEAKVIADKRSALQNLKQLVTEHPALANNLKGIISAKAQINALNKEIESLEIKDADGNVTGYSDSARVDKIKNTLIPELEVKATKNMNPLMDYISKKGLDIKESDINELVEDSDPNIDLSTLFSRTTKRLTREIKGMKKDYLNRKSAYENINKYRTPEPTPNPAPEPTPNPALEPTPEPTPTPEPPIEKPKWYQFGKKFKNITEKVKGWVGKRRQARLPEGTPEPTPEPITPPTARKSHKAFEDSYKFDIVKDVAEKMEHDALINAKNANKQTAKSTKGQTENKGQQSEGREPGE